MILQVPEGIPYRGRGHWAVALLVLLCVATVAIVGLRLYSRHKILKQSIFGWMDWCIIVSTISMLAFAALQLFNILNNGLGVHIVDLPKLFRNDHDYFGAYIAIRRIVNIQRFFYDLSTCLIKLSILLFLYTLSPYRSFHFLIYILIFLIVVLALISTILTVFFLFGKCAALLPPSRRSTGLHCGRGFFVVGRAFPVCNAVLDAICWLIPMHFAWQLSGWKKKFRVAVVLCMGFTAVIASIVRIVILNRLIGSVDVIWHFFDIGVWSVVELAMGIICACCPALMPIIRLINTKIRAPDSAQPSGRTIAAVRRDLENIEVELHSGLSSRKIEHTSPGTSSNHENMLRIGTLQRQDGDSFHAVGINGRAYHASTEAFVDASSTGGSLSRISTVALSLETVDANSNHERSIADVELGSGGGVSR